MAKTIMQVSEEISNVYALGVFCDNQLGTQSEVRIVLPDGTTVSKGLIKVVILTDGSEVFEVHLS